MGYCVTTDNGSKIVCLSKSVTLINQFTPTGCGTLWGVTYCPHRDVYVVCDKDKHCLWSVDSASGTVVQQMGSQGHGDKQF